MDKSVLRKSGALVFKIVFENQKCYLAKIWNGTFLTALFERVSMLLIPKLILFYASFSIILILLHWLFVHKAILIKHSPIRTLRESAPLSQLSHFPYFYSPSLFLLYQYACITTNETSYMCAFCFVLKNTILQGTMSLRRGCLLPTSLVPFFLLLY